MDLEEVQVATYLRGHPDFLQQWLERNADKQLLETVQRKWAAQEDSETEEDEGPKKSSDSRPNVSLSVGLDLSSLNAKYNQALNKSQSDDNDNEDDTMDDEPSPSVVPRTARKSVTSDLFHQWLASGTSSTSAARKDTLLGRPRHQHQLEIS